MGEVEEEKKGEMKRGGRIERVTRTADKLRRYPDSEWDRG